MVDQPLAEAVQKDPVVPSSRVGYIAMTAMLTSICRSIVTICSGLYLLIGMTRFSSKWILSHSTWYKFRRSRH